MTTRTDRTAAVRIAWAATKLTRAGRHPIAIGRLAATVGFDPGEAHRLMELMGFDIRDGLVIMDRGSRPGTADRAGSDRYRVDLFLLAIATGEPVHADATCPATGARVRVHFTRDRVLSVDPPHAVVAASRLPGIDLTLGPDYVEALVCTQFFASKEAAAGWLLENIDGRVLSVPDYLAHTRRMVAALESWPTI
ncbi:organomercurial lyase [Amycolatopsis regifaucium]|uniref:Alkylmercury lyase n=1 Tax=Amycolatopsis regifaucium TaxID=546365 RepID=A0A154M7R0_9PSEU|nr:organomercurial lyase [Amycolatopsis regifaucium]KZB80655.1 alkylmercury lyase [Amycolatopsis regifaucium]OKA03103.1 alkylmercury lyase [Amycolatopsis regifaucium]SFH01836.1 alkylmercury lyase [Amycolatopsis regifaucium]